MRSMRGFGRRAEYSDSMVYQPWLFQPPVRQWIWKRRAEAKLGNNIIWCTFTWSHITSHHFTSLHFISLHFTSFHFTSLHFISFHFISFHFISFQFIPFHFISFHISNCIEWTQGRRRYTAPKRELGQVPRQREGSMLILKDYPIRQSRQDPTHQARSTYINLGRLILAVLCRGFILSSRDQNISCWLCTPPPDIIDKVSNHVTTSRG